MKRRRYTALSEKQQKYTKHARAVFVVLAIASFGLYFLNMSQAATPTAAIETEDGVITPPATPVDDMTASGNKAVRFDDITLPPNGGCAVNGVLAPCIGDANTGASNWGNLVFSDEFNASTLDTNKWSPCWFPGSFNGSDACGVMNDSVTRKSNVSVKDGFAVLRQSSTQEDSMSDSGSLINTDPSQVGSGGGFQMGSGHYAEARVYFPGNGSNCYNWPAWWINGGKLGFSDGEIDVAEIGGSGRMTTNYHFDRGNGREIKQFTIGSGSDWCDTYHIYGVDRQKEQNIIYVDGVEATRYPTYDNGAPQYLIFNVGYKTGKTPMSGAASDVKIDYVRIWKK